MIIHPAAVVVFLHHREKAVRTAPVISFPIVGGLSAFCRPHGLLPDPGRLCG